MVLVAALAGAASAALLARRRRKDDRGRTGSRPSLAMVVPGAVRRGAPLLTSPAPLDVGRAPDNRRRPREGDRKPREGDRKPREGDRKPREGGRKPREGGRKPREGGRKPREGDRKPREGDRKPPDRKPPDRKPPGRAPTPMRAVPDPPPPTPSRVASPPEPTIAWKAEIDWRQKNGTGQFRVIATARDGRTAVVGRSAFLEWPPGSPEAVQALTAAADRLEASLLAAGWRKLAPGASWYARRFGWEPAPTGPRPPEAEGGSGRFSRVSAWPDGTEERWRCEITWNSGYVSSYFEATVYPPGRKRGKAIGASERFKWLLMGEPDRSHAEHVREARRLAAALRDAGWKRLAHGAAWYAARFVWPGDDAPPEQLELAPEMEGGAR